MIAVIDTNVVVSGLMTRDPEAPTARILDGMLAVRFSYLLSLELIDEYRRVLLRPSIRDRHGLAESAVDLLLERLVKHAVVRQPEDSSAEVIRGDSHLLALLGAVPSSVLVTGDLELARQAPEWAGVLSPRAFLDWVEALS